MLRNLKRRDRNALVAAGVGVVLFVLAQYAIFPWLDAAPSLGEGVEAKELSLQRAQRLVAASQAESAKLSKVEGRLASLEAGLLQSPSASLANAEWQQAIRELADSKGMNLESSEFLRVQPLNPDYALMAGRIQFRCGVDQLVDFMIALANAPKLLSVTQLRAVPLQGDPKKQVSVSMTVGAVMRAEKGVSPATAKPR